MGTLAIFFIWLWPIFKHTLKHVPRLFLTSANQWFRWACPHKRFATFSQSSAQLWRGLRTNLRSHWLLCIWSLRWSFWACGKAGSSLWWLSSNVPGLPRHSRLRRPPNLRSYPNLMAQLSLQLNWLHRVQRTAPTDLIRCECRVSSSRAPSNLPCSSARRCMCRYRMGSCTSRAGTDKRCQVWQGSARAGAPCESVWW